MHVQALSPKDMKVFKTFDMPKNNPIKLKLDLKEFPKLCTSKQFWKGPESVLVSYT